MSEKSREMELLLGEVAHSSLMKNRKARNSVEQRWDRIWQMGIEDALALRTTKDKQVGS